MPNFNIMTLNSGSSSVKYSLWHVVSQADKLKLCAGAVERVTIGGSFIKQEAKAREVTVQRECADHDAALDLIVQTMTHESYGVIGTLSEISAVGHRVVHGGEIYSRSVLVDQQVVKAIEECSVLAPLHNPPNLSGMRAAMKLMPQIPHVAVFDTAFFSTMPRASSIYPVPYEWYEKYRIKRYGFHGASHLYVSRRAAALLGKKASEVNLITLHIGNGVSITAIKQGLAYDHSMGFTPLEGAVMGTRCGDIDPAIPLHVMEKENLSASQMYSILNRDSGLIGITRKHVDRRDILKAAKEGDNRAELAFEIECYRLKKYVGAYYAALGEVDAIVFTAGVGENSPEHRERVCEGLHSLGIVIDPEANRKAVGRKAECEISVPSSKVKVFVIPTDEELVLVEDVLAIMRGEHDHFTKRQYSFERPDFEPAYSRR